MMVLRGGRSYSLSSCVSAVGCRLWKPARSVAALQKRTTAEGW